MGCPTLSLRSMLVIDIQKAGLISEIRKVIQKVLRVLKRIGTHALITIGDPERDESPTLRRIIQHLFWYLLNFYTTEIQYLEGLVKIYRVPRPGFRKMGKCKNLYFSQKILRTRPGYPTNLDPPLISKKIWLAREIFISSTRKELNSISFCSIRIKYYWCILIQILIRIELHTTSKCVYLNHIYILFMPNQFVSTHAIMWLGKLRLSAFNRHRFELIGMPVEWLKLKTKKRASYQLLMRVPHAPERKRTTNI